GLVTLEQVDRAIVSELNLVQSLLVVWPQLVVLLAMTAAMFAISYVAFVRQEVRAWLAVWRLGRGPPHTTVQTGHARADVRAVKLSRWARSRGPAALAAVVGTILTVVAAYSAWIHDRDQQRAELDRKGVMAVRLVEETVSLAQSKVNGIQAFLQASS